MSKRDYMLLMPGEVKNIRACMDMLKQATTDSALSGRSQYFILTDAAKLLRSITDSQVFREIA